MSDLAGLDIVCKHFRLSRDGELTKMKRQKQRLSPVNYRLRRQVERLRAHLELERTICRKLQLLLCRAASRLEGLSRGLSDIFQ